MHVYKLCSYLRLAMSEAVSLTRPESWDSVLAEPLRQLQQSPPLPDDLDDRRSHPPPLFIPGTAGGSPATFAAAGVGRRLSSALRAVKSSRWLKRGGREGGWRWQPLGNTEPA